MLNSTKLQLTAIIFVATNNLPNIFLQYPTRSPSIDFAREDAAPLKFDPKLLEAEAHYRPF